MFFDWKNPPYFLQKILHISGKSEDAVVFPDFPAGIRRFVPGLPELRCCG
jgi:hypothetical protein